MKKAILSLVILSGLIISCNNSSEEKTEVKDTTVMPTPAPVTPPDSTGKGEQAPPPKTN